MPKVILLMASKNCFHDIGVPRRDALCSVLTPHERRALRQTSLTGPDCGSPKRWPGERLSLTIVHPPGYVRVRIGKALIANG